MRHQVEQSAPEALDWFLEGYAPAKDDERGGFGPEDGHARVVVDPFDVYGLLAEKGTDGAEDKVGKPVLLAEEDAVGGVLLTG